MFHIFIKRKIKKITFSAVFILIYKSLKGQVFDTQILNNNLIYFLLFLLENYEDLFVAERRENWAIMTFGTFQSQCRITVPRNPLVLQGTPQFYTIHSKWSLFK